MLKIVAATSAGDAVAAGKGATVSSGGSPFLPDKPWI